MDIMDIMVYSRDELDFYMAKSAFYFRLISGNAIYGKWKSLCNAHVMAYYKDKWLCEK